MANPANTSLPSGEYEYVDGEFVFIRSQAPELLRYHGTIQPKGTVINKFKMERSIDKYGKEAGVFSSYDPMSALRYGLSKHHMGKQGDQVQMYVLVIRPRTYIDLGDCRSSDAVRQAIDAGFDVIDCPDFPEQPETVVFDPERIGILMGYRINYNNDTVPEEYIKRARPINSELEEFTRNISDRYNYYMTPIEGQGTMASLIADAPTAAEYDLPFIYTNQQDPLPTVDDGLIREIDDYISKSRNQYNPTSDRGMEYRPRSVRPSYKVRNGRGRID